MYKYAIFLLLSSVSLFAVDITQVISTNERESFTYCVKEHQKVDTGDWITYPINFGIFNIESPLKEENVKVSFPSEPTFVEENGLQSSYFTASDKDGMIYSIASMPIPGDDFSLRNSVDFLAKSISKSSSKKLVCMGYPSPNPNDSVHFIMWVENDKMTRLTLVKSTHFIYFLETTIENEIYKDVDPIEMDTEAFDIMIRDSLKTGAFTRSLVIEEN